MGFADRLQDVRHEAGTSALLRQRFARTGTLQNTIDDTYRGIMEAEPVFAFSKLFVLNESSSFQASGESVLFTIAHIQDPVVQIASARGLTFMRPLWLRGLPLLNHCYHFTIWTTTMHSILQPITLLS